MTILDSHEAKERPQTEVARTVPDPSYAVTHNGYNRVAIGEPDTEENRNDCPKVE